MDGDHDTLHVLVGPTAAGKSALALELAEQAGAEIVSMDSMQVYRGMDVGTAKPSPEEQARVRHHLIDLVEPSERYDARRWVEEATAVLAELAGRGRRALVVGGTGLYLKALCDGIFDGPAPDLEVRSRLQAEALRVGSEALHERLRREDPAAADRIHPRDEKRIVRALEVLEQTGKPISHWQARSPWRRAAQDGGTRRVVVAGLALEPDRLDERIRTRTEAMLAAGWVEEARRIRDTAGFGPSAVQALGYAEVLAHADGELERDELVERIALRTRQFARRQRTWWRKFPDIEWLDADRARTEAARRIFGWD